MPREYLVSTQKQITQPDVTKHRRKSTFVARIVARTCGQFTRLALLRTNFEYPVSTWAPCRKDTMTIKLTDRFLTSRKPPLTGRAVYTDTVVPGLAFRVSAITARNPEGRRDWFLRYRPRREGQKAVALGAYPAVSLSMARQRAGEIVGAAKRGTDLIATEEREAEVRRSAEAKARPLSELANAYLDSVKPRLRSFRSIESRTRCHIIPKLGNKPLGEVTRGDVVEFLDRLERERACGTKSTVAGKHCGRSLLMPSNAI